MLRADELDPQARAVLDMMDERGVLPSEAISVEDGRRLLDDFLSVDDPEAVSEVRDVSIPATDGQESPEPTIPLRIYTPSSGERPYPVLVYFHGGGWVRGSLDSHDPVCRRLANAAECLVVSVGYGRSPENRFPSALRECHRATEWASEYAESLHADPDRVAVGGDSAGGNLAAAVCLLARERGGPDIVHQSLVYPVVSHPDRRHFESYDQNAEGYFLELSGMRWYFERYVDDDVALGNEYALPLHAESHADLPPATVLTCGYDPLRDECIAYAKALESAGVSANRVHYPAQIHGLLNLFEFVDAGEDAIEAVAADLRAAF